MQYDQQTAEWTSKLVEYQLEAADKLDAGKLRDKLIKALQVSWFHTKDLCGRQISPIDVMNHIEKIFVDTGDMKTQNNHFLVKTGTGLPLPAVTRLVNRQFKLIVKLNPVNQGSMALYYDAWEFFCRPKLAPNRELNKANVIQRYFTAAAVTRRKWILILEMDLDSGTPVAGNHPLVSMPQQSTQ